MTIEEKAKAYDEALKKLRTMHKAWSNLESVYPARDTVTDLEYYFPELRESEDEAIRKRAIAILKQQRDYWSYDGPMDKCPPLTMRQDLVDAVNAALSYLEKQKEQKPVECTPDSALQKIKRAITDCKKLSELYKDRKENLHQYYGGKAEGLQLALTYFGNEYELAEQKPNYCHHEVDETGWTEEYRKAYYDGWNNCNMQHEQLKADQKPAEWSEEDEKMFASISNLLWEGYGCFKENKIPTPEWSKIRNWLKSIRPSWKPSEDEERLINTSISFLKDFADKGYENAVECVDWLKSKLNGNSGK